jgi:hypothetical protein
MAKFIVKVAYRPVPTWAPETAHLFDPPSDPSNPADRIRMYTALIHARNESEAVRKAIDSRREVEVEKRMYRDTVVGSHAQKYP